MLLQRKGAQWEEKRIDLDHGLVNEMLQRVTGRRSADIHRRSPVGGYDDMAELDAMGDHPFSA